jgi:hypothetical protein
MIIKWKESIKIDDGKYQGIISKIEYREKPFSYTDIFIIIEQHDVQLKYSCPTNLTPESKLGRLLIALGEKFNKNKEVDIEKILVGKQVELMIMNKPSKKDKTKEYAEIVEDSIKPIKVNIIK